MAEADEEVPSWVVQWAADEMAVAGLDASVLQDAYADWAAFQEGHMVAFAYHVVDTVEAAVAEAVESCCLPFSEEEEAVEDLLFPASYDSLALALEGAAEEAHGHHDASVVLPFLSLVLCHQNFPCPRSPPVLCPSCEEEEDEVLDSSPPVHNDPVPFPEEDLRPSVPSALSPSPQNHRAWEDRILLFQARLSPAAVQSLALPSASAVHALRVLPLAVLALPSALLVHDSY